MDNLSDYIKKEMRQQGVSMSYYNEIVGNAREELEDRGKGSTLSKSDIFDIVNAHSKF